MSRLRFRISISLDGFVAGPEQSVKNPLGIGGMRLHEWVVPLKAWRTPHGLEGGEVNESSKVIEEQQRVLQGGTTFTFVTEGIHKALELARRAALEKDVSLAGGAAAARQYLVAGLVDEMELNLAPTLLGLALVRTVATPKVVHLKLARK